MKFLIILAGLLACTMAQFGQTPFRSNFNTGSRKFSSFNSPRFQSFKIPAQTTFLSPAFGARAYQTQPAYANSYAAQTYNVVNDQGPDGSYRYSYQTPEGTSVEASGTPKLFGGNPPVAPVVSQGSFQWISPEGIPVSIAYVADEFGYRANGNAIPTPPPVPAAIQRSLEYIRSRQAGRSKY